MVYQCQICSKTVKPSRVKRLIPVHNGLDGTECPASRYVAGEEGAWLALQAKLDAAPAPEITFTAEEVALLEDYGYEVETCTPKTAREAYNLASCLRGSFREWTHNPIEYALINRLDPTTETEEPHQVKVGSKHPCPACGRTTQVTSFGTLRRHNRFSGEVCDFYFGAYVTITPKSEKANAFQISQNLVPVDYTPTIVTSAEQWRALKSTFPTRD